MLATERRTLTVTLPSDREIRMTRAFDALRWLVFEAHLKPEHLARWWGRTGSSLPVCELDARPGGAWRFVHRAADGREDGFHGVIREITPPSRIVWTFEHEGLPGHVSVETLEFSEEDGRTTLTSTRVFDSVEDRDGMLRSGMEAGASETLVRLEAFLALPGPTHVVTDRDAHELIVTRTFDAPPDRVFAAWSSCEQISRWWGPRQWPVAACTMDFRPGGVWHYAMRGPSGEMAWGRVVYQEIVEPIRIAYTDAFSDADGKINEALPVMRITVEFEDLGGRTRLTNRGRFASAEELQVVVDMGVVPGLTETWDRLEELLAKP